MTVNQARQLIKSYEIGVIPKSALIASIYRQRGNGRKEILKYLLKKEDKICLRD